MAPVLISPPNGSFNQPSTVRFVWTKPLNSATYRLQVSYDSLFNNILVNDSTLTDSTIVVTNLTNNKYFWWRVNAKNTAGTSPYSAVWKFGTFLVGMEQIGTDIPKEFRLYTSFPNPFNPTAKIRFDIPLSKGISGSAGKGVLTELQIFDILGRNISILVNEQLQPGTYEVNFDGSNYPSGIYFYKLTSGSFTQVRKMILLK